MSMFDNVETFEQQNPELISNLVNKLLTEENLSLKGLTDDGKILKKIAEEIEDNVRELMKK